MKGEFKPETVKFLHLNYTTMQEVSVAFNAERWEATHIDEMLPFHSTNTFEEMERYCDENNFQISFVIGEDGEAL